MRLFREAEMRAWTKDPLKGSMRVGIHAMIGGILYLLLLSSFGAVALLGGEEDLESMEPLEPLELDESEWQGSVYGELIWESRYVSEGRDYLDGNGTITGFSSLGYRGLAIDTSFREGDDLKYSELNVGPSYEYEFEDFAISAYYYHLRFIRQDFGDHEVGLGVNYSGLPLNLVLSADCYYSFRWEGSFSIVALSTDWQIGDRISIEPEVSFGINSNYVPFAHDGPNHASLRLDAAIELWGPVSLTGYIAQNWAIGKEPYELSPGDYSLKDFFWGGVGVMVAF